MNYTPGTSNAWRKDAFGGYSRHASNRVGNSGVPPAEREHLRDEIDLLIGWLTAARADLELLPQPHGVGAGQPTQPRAGQAEGDLGFGERYSIAHQLAIGAAAHQNGHSPALSC